MEVGRVIDLKKRKRLIAYKDLSCKNNDELLVKKRDVTNH